MEESMVGIGEALNELDGHALIDRLFMAFDDLRKHNTSGRRIRLSLAIYILIRGFGASRADLLLGAQLDKRIESHPHRGDRRDVVSASHRKQG